MATKLLTCNSNVNLGEEACMNMKWEPIFFLNKISRVLFLISYFGNSKRKDKWVVFSWAFKQLSMIKLHYSTNLSTHITSNQNGCVWLDCILFIFFLRFILFLCAGVPGGQSVGSPGTGAMGCYETSDMKTELRSSSKVVLLLAEPPPQPCILYF